MTSSAVLWCSRQPGSYSQMKLIPCWIACQSSRRKSIGVAMPLTHPSILPAHLRRRAKECRYLTRRGKLQSPWLMLGLHPAICLLNGFACATGLNPPRFCRFADQAFGKDSIRKLLPQICQRAGVERRTNHALRRTSISAMFAAGMSVAAIMKRSRHKSIDALMSYHRCVPFTFCMHVWSH